MLVADNEPVEFFVQVIDARLEESELIQVKAKPRSSLTSLLGEMKSPLNEPSKLLKQISSRCKFYTLKDPLEHSDGNQTDFRKVMSSLHDEKKYTNVGYYMTAKMIAQNFMQDYVYLVIVDVPAQSMSHKRRRIEDEIEDAPSVGPSGVHPLPSSREIEQIALIHDEIRGLPDTMDFSDPSMFTILPFPSLLKIPFQRFRVEWREQDDVPRFSYMGRSKFAELYEHIQKRIFLEGNQAIYLYGTSGSGKSYILAALLANFTSVIRSALRFAFYDSELHLRTIESADREGLLNFWAGQTDIYFVVDQLNVLELGGYNSNVDHVKKEVLRYVKEMEFEHKFIFSASANESSNRDTDMKQARDGVTVVPINGGLTEEETNCWFTHYAAELPPLTDEDRQLVEYQTGRIPLLLRALFNNEKFDYDQFMRQTDLLNVSRDVLGFFTKKQVELKEPHEKNIYFAIMDACLQSSRLGTDKLELYDLRYFYIDQKKIGHFTCGVAFETMMMLFRQDRLSWF